MTGDGSSGRRWHKECECHLFISITLRISVGSQRVSTRLTLRATSERARGILSSSGRDSMIYFSIIWTLNKRKQNKLYNNRLSIS